MKRYFALLLLLVITAFAGQARAQYYTSGQDPASIKWNQINSDNYQVIYPVGYDSIAQYVMNVMEYARELTMQSHHTNPKKISIILHNQTIISNAEVAWAPRRMEFFTVGPQNNYSQEWFQQLAIHEYVHVLQISSMNQGLTKFMYNLFGEQITVGVFGLYVPYWFIEGDAVVSETALSEAGRGRDPNFEMELRAQLLEIGPYSLEKASLGSYEDFTPDRYCLGYYMVGQGRVGFGRDMWNKPMANVGRYPLAIVPFSTGINTKTGMTKLPFYQWSMRELTKNWSVQLANTQPDNVNAISNQKKYINYSQNAYFNGGDIFSLKKSYHQIGQFVRFDKEGNEEIILYPGYYMSDRISTGGDYISWIEIKYDPRWDNRKNNKVLLYNYRTGKKKTLVKKERYFSPQLSGSGAQLAVVEVDEWNNNFLVILHTETAEVLHRIPALPKTSLAHPSWNAEENKLVVEVLSLYGKSLMIMDLEQKEWNKIIDWQTTHILNPRFWEDFVLYEASYNGVMNVYAVNLKDQSLFQTTNVAFGAGDYQINEQGDEILLSSYTSLGKVVGTQKWDKNDWIPFSQVKDNRYPLADMLSAQEDTILKSEHIPQKKYEEKKYNKFTHLFNIHSWNFIHADADNGSLNPGVSILSQNKLSTMTARIGADYSYNAEAMRYYAQIDYLGWYPVLSFGADYGGKWTDIIEEIELEETTDTTRHYYKETNFDASVYVPLIYTSGIWAHSIQPQAGLQYKQIDQGSEIDFNYRNLKTSFIGISYSAQSKSPSQNLYPRWGFAMSAAYRSTIDMTDQGNMLLAGASVYIPGIFRHDGIRFNLTYQDKEGDTDFYSDWASPARGYSSLSYNDLLTLRADYQVPLVFPDINLGSLIYMKRINLGLFYDYSQQTDLKPEEVYRDYNYFWSSGAELTTTVHFLRSKFPFEIGLRASYVDGYVKNPEAMVYQFIWGVGL